MKRVAEYKIVFLLMTGLILTLPAMAQSLTGVSTVAEATGSGTGITSEYSLERITTPYQLPEKVPGIVTNSEIVVMNVTISKEDLYKEGVEILGDSPWRVKGIEDPVAEETADRKEYIVDSVFPYGLDNGPELNNILISTFDTVFYLPTYDVMCLPDLYTEDFEDEEVDEFLLESIGYAVWDEVLSQEDKEEYLIITENFNINTANESILGRTTVHPCFEYRKIEKEDMNDIFEDNTCWHEWVYDPESTKVYFKLDVDEETFSNDAGFQSLSEDKQKEFLKLWQKADEVYKEDMLEGDCRELFSSDFFYYIKGQSLDIAKGESKVKDSFTSTIKAYAYESREFMANIFSRFGAEEGYTYVYDYDEDTNEITRYQAELVEIEGYLLPDNPVLDE